MSAHPEDNAPQGIIDKNVPPSPKPASDHGLNKYPGLRRTDGRSYANLPPLGKSFSFPASVPSLLEVHGGLLKSALAVRKALNESIKVSTSEEYHLLTIRF